MGSITGLGIEMASDRKLTFDESTSGLHLPEFPDRDFLALVARCCAENSRTGNIACLLH